MPPHDFVDLIERELGRIKAATGLKDSLETIHALWEQFSEEEYCAGFMVASKVTIANFLEWLKHDSKGE